MRAPALVCLQAFPAARLTHTPAPTYQEPRQALRTHQGRSRSRSSLFDQLLYTYVLDKSVPVYALDVQREMLGGKRGLVPALWHLEIANGLAMADRKSVRVGK